MFDSLKDQIKVEHMEGFPEKKQDRFDTSSLPRSRCS